MATIGLTEALVASSEETTRLSLAIALPVGFVLIIVLIVLVILAVWCVKKRRRHATYSLDKYRFHGNEVEHEVV